MTSSRDPDKTPVGVKVPARDGSVLPFPSMPPESVAGPTLQESTLKPFPEERHLPKDAPNILIVLLDDVGFGLPDTFGRRDPYADADRGSPSKASATTISHHLDLLADPGGAADRPQPSACRLRHDRRTRGRFRRLHRRIPRKSATRRARCCAITATRPRPSASGTTRPRRKPRPWARSRLADRLRDRSTISTDSWPARRRNRSRACWRTPLPIEPPRDEKYHLSSDTGG